MSYKERLERGMARQGMVVHLQSMSDLKISETLGSDEILLKNILAEWDFVYLIFSLHFIMR